MRRATPARAKHHAAVLGGNWSSRGLIAAVAIAAASPGRTQTSAAAPGQPPAATIQSNAGGLATLLSPGRSTVLGDMFGLRAALGGYGITLSLTDTDEVLGNLSGGIRRGATYEGLTTLTIQLDTLKAFGWAGGTFNVSFLQIRGRDLSQFNLDTLETASGIEAENTTRFWEIWYDQTLFDNKADVKIGQQSVDREFIISQGASLFINSAMGWPIVPMADLYAGGPAAPLSSLGVRLRVQPGGGITGLGGVFQDNPPGGPFDDDSQLRGSTRWGGNFNLRTGALFIAELQFALNQPPTGETVRSGRQTGLAGTYKLGFWYDTAPFPSPRFDNAGLSLADPKSDGVAAMLRHNFSIYGVVDQVIWQPDRQAARAAGIFVRVIGAPGDRNLVSFGANAGVTLKAPLPDRDDDIVGVGFGLAKLSGATMGLSRDIGLFTRSSHPLRSSETFIEVTYQAQIAPWLQVQPDFQYVFNPGGGIADPDHPSRRIGNELVLGARTNVTF